LFNKENRTTSRKETDDLNICDFLFYSFKKGITYKKDEIVSKHFIRGIHLPYNLFRLEH